MQTFRFLFSLLVSRLIYKIQLLKIQLKNTYLVKICLLIQNYFFRVKVTFLYELESEKYSVSAMRNFKLNILIRHLINKSIIFYIFEFIYIQMSMQLNFPRQHKC